jgi:hypothetical protein
VVTNCVCPQLATFLPADMYSDYTRVADPVWQRRDSFFWSAGPDEEKAAAAKAVASLVRTGHIEQHLWLPTQKGAPAQVAQDGIECSVAVLYM